MNKKKSNEALLPQPYQVGSVYFLNSRPLTYQLEDQDEVSLDYAAPSSLAGAIEEGSLHAALIPSIDYQLSSKPLTILPAGAVCSVGEVLTVRVFSKTPLSQIDTLYCDSDSHTSIVLAQIIWKLKFNRRLTIAPLQTSGEFTEDSSILLIGDKVLEQLDQWPHELDLGLAWNQLTDLPFVYAFWVASGFVEAGPLVEILRQAYLRGVANLGRIAELFGPQHGFDPALAEKYLSHHLSFTFGPQEMRGLAKFYQLAHEFDLITENRPLNLYRQQETPLPRSTSCQTQTVKD